MCFHPSHLGVQAILSPLTSHHSPLKTPLTTKKTPLTPWHDLDVFQQGHGLHTDGEGGVGGLDDMVFISGFSGTPNILPALSRSGHHKEAYRLFTSQQLPSWLYPVTKNATSIWERWNGYEAAFGPEPENNMNSFNHFALGAVGSWMFAYQLGITNGSQGYHHFVLQPTVGSGYSSLYGCYESDYGLIESGWEADGNGCMLTYHATVPPNTTANLYLPVENDHLNVVTTKGAQFHAFQQHNNVLTAHFTLLSGKHQFTLTEHQITVR